MMTAPAASGGPPQSLFTLSRGLLDAAGCCREELEFIANTLIFVLSGALITSRIWESATEHAVNDIHPADFAYAILLWVYLLVSPVAVPAGEPCCRTAAAMRCLSILP